MTGPAAGTPLDLSAIAGIVDAGGASPEACRAALAAGTEAVHAAFEADVPASALLAGRTAVVDLVLTRLWHRAGAAFDGLALAAVGGYGRAELHPASDVDIAVLLPDDGGAPGDDGDAAAARAARDEAIGAWIRGLWDLGLDVGHSVRTVAESADAARADLTVVTNLMEARLVAGDPAPLEAVRRAIAPARMWPPDAFLEAKLEERAARHRRFGQNPYRLEPNVKGSEGGLRDIQTIAWVCRRHFGPPGPGPTGAAGELAPLVDHGLLEPRELERLGQGLELLWRIRYLLHRLAGREEDRLLFDYQKRIAHALGHPEDAHGNADVEALMQRFYRTLAGLQRLSEMCLQGLGRIVRGDAGAVPAAVPIDARFALRGGYLEAVHEEVFVHYPAALLELFLAFGRTPAAVGIDAQTVRLIRRHLKLVNARFRSDPKVRATFLEVFRLEDRLVRTLRLMYRHGVLEAYLPAFDRIVGRMQYDLFHQYTVDEHTMLVIRNLRRFFLERFRDEFPHCSEVASRVARPHVLYLAALFHDIAKGRGGDHSVLGAVDMAEFAAEHALPADEAELATWLVRHHLDMSMTAQRRDIDDPDVQLEFARLAGSLERLDHLYLLTVADIRATNPELWNSFRKSLLQALYRHARLLLEGGLDEAPVVDEVIARRQARARAMLDPATAADPALETLWRGLGDDWFRQHQAVGIARHTEALLAHAAAGDPGPLVAVRHAPSRGAAEILIQAPDDAALFALIATALEGLGLDVLSAVVHTTADGRALDTFDVLEADGSLVEDPGRLDEIRRALLAALAAPPDPETLAVRRTPRRLRHFRTPTAVEVAARDDGLAELRIETADRPVILSSIGRRLAAAGVSVQGARIATLGERVEDVFFVTGADGTPWHDPEAHERLRATLRERLG